MQETLNLADLFIYIVIIIFWCVGFIFVLLLDSVLLYSLGWPETHFDFKLRVLPASVS